MNDAALVMVQGELLGRRCQPALVAGRTIAIVAGQVALTSLALTILAQAIWGPEGDDDPCWTDDARRTGTGVAIDRCDLPAVYLAIGLVFNVVGEELYYRGYLLPRMRGTFGRWDWVANGVLFTMKHVYQRWLMPGMLVGGLAFAFTAGPLGSLPLAMVFHWVGNFLLQSAFLVGAALGVG